MVNDKILKPNMRDNGIGMSVMDCLCAGFLAAGLGEAYSMASGSVNVLALVLCTLLAPAFVLLSRIKPLARLYPLVPLCLAVIFALINLNGFTACAKDLADCVIKAWNERFYDAVAVSNVTVTALGRITYGASMICLVSAFVCLMIRLCRPFLTAVALMLLAVPCLVLDIFSDSACALVCIGVLIQFMSCCEPHWNMKKVCWISAVILLFSGIAMLFDNDNIEAVDSVRQSTSEAVENIRYGTDTLPQGDMSKAYLMNKGDTQTLNVTQSNPRTLYLRGFVGASYTDGLWSTLTRADFRGDNEGIEDWLDEQGFEPALQYRLYSSAANSPYEENKVEIENVGANRKYLYLPYSAYDVSETVKTKKDFSAVSLGLFGSDSYTFTEKSSSDPGELLFPDEWVLNPTDEKQEDYCNSEEIYRSFVYSTYLDIDESVSELINEKFVEASDLGDSPSVYDVTQYIHEVLEETSVYDEEPEKTDSDEPLEEFLNGGEGNSAMYATAAVLAFRANGIPARYAEGYYCSASSSSQLTSKNAHAWAEVYMDALGWVPIDVTPGYYYDAYALMEMLQKPENIDKTAALEDEGNDADKQDHDSAGKGKGKLPMAAKSIALTLLGILAVLILLAVLTLAALEIRNIILSARLEARLKSSDALVRQETAYKRICTLLACIGIQVNIGWNSAETEAAIRERLDDIEEGEYVRINELAEKLIYGEQPLPPHEERTFMLFMRKLQGTDKKNFTKRERLKLRYTY